MSTVLGIRGEEPDPDALGLRVEVTGAQGSEYTYDLCFHELSALDDDDVTYRIDDLTVIIPGTSVDKLRGAELDLPRANGQGGLVIRNPNRADPLAGIDVELSGDVAEQVAQLLEQSINPVLASHGGYRDVGGCRRGRERLRDDGWRLPGVFGQRRHAEGRHPSLDHGAHPRGP